MPLKDEIKSFRYGGLFGVNGGHYPMVFIPGVSTIKADPQSPEENAETYAESQQQRALERKLREEKRELGIMKAQGAPDEEIRAQRAKVRRASSDIDAFCDETGRTRRRANEYTPVNASWDGADIDAARMSGYSLTYGGKSGIIIASDGIEVKSLSSHAYKQLNLRRVNKPDISEAITNPLKIRPDVQDDKGRLSRRYIGNNATVNVNPDTGVVTTVWKTSTKTRNKYKKDVRA